MTNYDDAEIYPFALDDYDPPPPCALCGEPADYTRGLCLGCREAVEQGRVSEDVEGGAS